MSLFKSYSDVALKNALVNLRTGPDASDFPVIEEVEKVLTSRGYDVTRPEFGPDVIGEFIRSLDGVDRRKKKYKPVGSAKRSKGLPVGA